jgi:hypothetical protein
MDATIAAIIYNFYDQTKAGPTKLIKELKIPLSTVERNNKNNMTRSTARKKTTKKKTGKTKKWSKKVNETSAKKHFFCQLFSDEWVLR